MSLLLVRSIMRLRQAHHLTVLAKTATRSISITSNGLKQKQKPIAESSITTANERIDISTDVRPLGERIKENTKTASYLGVILFGCAVTGVMFFAIFRELLSSSSPQNVYSEALKLCIEDPRVQDTLGTPIKGFGEESRRRRRQHVAHSIYERNGTTYIRMQFYIQGIRNKATVHLEKQLDSDKYRYLFAQVDYYPNTTIIIQDNRLAMDGSAATQPLDTLKF